MDPSLQRVQVNVPRTPGAGEIQGAVQQIRLPGPSLWPLLLGIAIIVFVVGLMLLFMSDFPWVALVSLLFVFIGIRGWALENPNTKKLESPDSLIPTMKLASPISLMPTMKLESLISLIPTAKQNAIQANRQESAGRTMELDSRPISSYQFKNAERDPAARQDDLFRNQFHRF